MPRSNELIDTTVAELPVNASSSKDSMLQVKYNLSQQLLEQYIALEKTRKIQIDQMVKYLHAQHRSIYRLTGMLLASVVVNLYLVFRFFL